MFCCIHVRSVFKSKLNFEEKKKILKHVFGFRNLPRIQMFMLGISKLLVRNGEKTSTIFKNKKPKFYQIRHRCYLTLKITVLPMNSWIRGNSPLRKSKTTGLYYAYGVIQLWIPLRILPTRNHPKIDNINKQNPNSFSLPFYQPDKWHNIRIFNDGLGTNIER